MDTRGTKALAVFICMLGGLFILLGACLRESWAAGPGDTDLTFTNPATNELGLEIERKDGAGAFVKIGTAPKDATSAKDTTTVAGKSYTYRVRAWNNSLSDGSGSVQYSAYSNEATVSYPLAAPDAAPSALEVQ